MAVMLQPDVIGSVFERLQREQVIGEARSWIGTKFHNNQRLKGVGCDCLGLIVSVMETVGVVRDVPIPNYSPQFMAHSSEELYVSAVLDYCDEVEMPEMGDLAFFKFGRCYSHAGLVVSWPHEMIHSYCGRGVERVDPTRDAQLKKRYLAARFFSPWRKSVH
jgi:NlpC/P60 family putative phage cell wall peptidase